MSVTIQDNATAQMLAQTVGALVDVFGPEGQLLGRFTPAPRPGMNFPEFGMTDEEMQRIMNDPDSTWVTGEAVLARLRSLRDTK